MFEVPTGVVADTWGRRASYLLGAAHPAGVDAALPGHVEGAGADVGLGAASVLLGLGFTFFSGATEAWLVDALASRGVRRSSKRCWPAGRSCRGAAMLAGSVAGGFIAQVTNLGVPYVVRSVLLGLTLVVAFVAMKDLGFTPDAARARWRRCSRCCGPRWTTACGTRPCAG